MTPIVFMNIGWMLHYRGLTESDRIVNGGKYVVENNDGLEAFNFKPVGRKHFAYVEPPRGGMLNLARLGASSGDEYVDNVTCVFTATRPKFGRVVIGWYKNARVYREVQRFSIGRGLTRRYLASCSLKDAKLLPPDLRTLKVPRARAGVWGMGQSTVRYTDERKSEVFKRALLKFMREPTAPPRSRGSGSRQTDPQLRVRIERAAVDAVTSHYQRMGFRVESVERDNVGWDLVATKHESLLLVEVKGCSGNAASAELTPNEYFQMRRNRAQYRLAIVTNALREDRRIRIVAYDWVRNGWHDDSGMLARIGERSGARVDLNMV